MSNENRCTPTNLFEHPFSMLTLTMNCIWYRSLWMVITQLNKWTLFGKTCSLLLPNTNCTSCKIRAPQIDKDQTLTSLLPPITKYKHRNFWKTKVQTMPDNFLTSMPGNDCAQKLLWVNLTYKQEKRCSSDSRVQQCKSPKEICQP